MDISAPSARVTSPVGLLAAPQGENCAYLIVHAESDGAPRLQASPWQRLRAWCRLGTRLAAPEALSLTLADRYGHTVLSLPEADPVLGIALAPGTYHLTAVRGNARRGYTVSLPAGSRFDLHLRFNWFEEPKPAAVATWPPPRRADPTACTRH